MKETNMLAQVYSFLHKTNFAHAFESKGIWKDFRKVSLNCWMVA